MINQLRYYATIQSSHQIHGEFQHLSSILALAKYLVMSITLSLHLDFCSWILSDAPSVHTELGSIEALHISDDRRQLSRV